MKTYIINLEIKDSEILEQVQKIIKRYDHCQILNNIWAIITDKKAVEIRDELLALMKKGDYIFVIKSGLEAAWSISSEFKSSEWLKNNL